MAFSIRLTEEERKLVDSYAKIHSISVGEAFKKALFEKLKKNSILPLLTKHIMSM